MRRVAFAVPVYRDHATPMADLNITPLIDVMLVLLVMFILILPAATHQVPIDLPQGRPDTSLPVQTHHLLLARDGGASLDGRAMDEAMLTARLHAMVNDPQAVLVMRTDPEARYERLDQTLAAVKRAGVTRLGFEGNAEMVRALR